MYVDTRVLIHIIMSVMFMCSKEAGISLSM